MASRRSLWGAACAAVFAAGCGGGQSGSAASAASHTATLGNATVTYSGQPKPQLVSSSGNVTVVGEAGATFSTVSLQPPPNLLDTSIVFSRQVDGYYSSLYGISYGTSSPTMILQSSDGAEDLAISAYGSILFQDILNYSFSVRPDGTGLKAVTFSGVSVVSTPNFSTDGTNRLVFNDDSGDLWVAPGTGGAATKIQSNANPAGCVWNPAGTEIAYPITTSSGYDIYETSPTGGSALDITPAALRNTGRLDPVSWSADGVTVLAEYLASGASVEELVKFSATDPSFYEVMTPAGDSDEFAYFSPDGSKIVFYRFGVGGATAGLYTMDASGANTALLYPDSASGAGPANGGLGWSPFLPKETVIAASGSTFYHQAASGFLLSQNGTKFGSVLAFTAATPADAAIQAPASDDIYSPLAFTITADSITSIGYINSYFNPGTTISLTSTPSAVITIDAGTGQVDLVAPASVAKPSASKNADGTLTYGAKFKAVYDGAGKNLAPNGASSLTVNPKTGKLVAFK